MVVVDTSVWIDFFCTPDSPWATTLEQLIAEHNRVVLCGIVLQEILQGIRDDSTFALTRDRLCRLPFLQATRESHLQAADIYRRLRSRGITVPSTDVAIAALAIDNQVELFSKDHHFNLIAEHSQLQLHPTDFVRKN